MSNLISAAATAVKDDDYTTAMSIGPPLDWEINLNPNEHHLAAVMTRPDEMLRVELVDEPTSSKYEVSLSGKIMDPPDDAWLSRTVEPVGHLLKGYAIMSFNARKHNTTEPPQLISYDIQRPPGRNIQEYNFEYSWGMKNYNVRVEEEL